MIRSLFLISLALTTSACCGRSSPSASERPEGAPVGVSSATRPTKPYGRDKGAPGSAGAAATAATAAPAAPAATAPTAALAGAGAAEYQANGFPKAMPSGKTAVPTEAEWGKAPVVTTKKLPPGCTMKFVREWLQMLCVKTAGAPAPVNVEVPNGLFGKMATLGSTDHDVGFVSTPERAELLARTMREGARPAELAGAEGVPPTTHFIMNGAIYTVGYHWPRGAPFPSTLFITTSEKVATKTGNNLFFDCRSSAECGAGLSCCVSGGGELGSNCSTQCNWSMQTKTCASDADCSDAPPAAMRTAVKLSKCRRPPSSPANAPAHCTDPASK